MQHMQSLLLSVLVGAGLGAAWGHFGKCRSGTCPLTANWWRGALYGAVLGLLFHSVAGGTRPGAAAEPTPNVTQISPDQFESQVMRAPVPVVVDFYATWCGPCKVLSPRLNELAGPLTNRVNFFKIDVDQANQLAERFQIKGVPTLLFFRDGKVADTVVGLLPKEDLKARLTAFAASAAPVEAQAK